MDDRQSGGWEGGGLVMGTYWVVGREGVGVEGDVWWGHWVEREVMVYVINLMQRWTCKLRGGS